MDMKEWDELNTPEPDDTEGSLLIFRCSEDGCGEHFAVDTRETSPEGVRKKFQQLDWIHIDCYNVCPRHAVRALACEVRVLLRRTSGISG